MTLRSGIEMRSERTSDLAGKPQVMRPRWPLIAAVLAVALLAIASLFIGPFALDLNSLISDPESRQIFLVSRVARTAALILSGVALSLAGLIMQMISQNKFVEPSTVGSMQFAALGLLVVTIVWPDASPTLRMVFTSTAAFAGTVIFMAILRRIAFRSTLIVPLVGIMLGGVVSAVTVYLALQFNLSQLLSSWQAGSFAGIIRGRYELLWLVAVVAVLAYLAADRFSAAGLGEGVATNIGLNYRRVMLFGTVIVAVVSGLVMAVIGFLPFLGLVVPNIVSMALGDNVRRGIPWVAVLGAGVLLACDIGARVVIAPAEIPAGTLLGIFGAVVFLVMILRRDRRAG